MLGIRRSAHWENWCACKSCNHRKAAHARRVADDAPALAVRPRHAASTYTPPMSRGERRVEVHRSGRKRRRVLARLLRRRLADKLLFTKRAYARVGGSESLAYQFATRLAARGHDVRVSARRRSTMPGLHQRKVEIVQSSHRRILGASRCITLVDLMRTDSSSGTPRT